jgi:hypothetical protein
VASERTVDRPCSRVFWISVRDHWGVLTTPTVVRTPQWFRQRPAAWIQSAQVPSTSHHKSHFLAHWTGGRLVLQGQGADLYDPAAKSALQVQSAGATKYLSWFISPSLTALMFVPFATLPHSWGALAWTGVSLVLLGWALFLVKPFLGHRQGDHALFVLAIFAAPAVLERISSGQVTAVAPQPAAERPQPQYRYDQARPTTRGACGGQYAEHQCIHQCPRRHRRSQAIKTAIAAAAIATCHMKPMETNATTPMTMALAPASSLG